MIALIQLVSHANVIVNNQVIAEIKRGILALIGFEKTDNREIIQKLLTKIIHYRIFPDAEGKTNLSLQEVRGGLLLVPQFTLVAETQKGTRPGFSRGMAPELGKELFTYLVNYARTQHTDVAAGEFGAYMQVSLCNNGPITFVLHT